KPQITLPSQWNQPKRDSKGAKEADFAGADKIRKSAPNDAADGSADRQEGKGHRDVGTKPSEFLLESLHENRHGAIRPESQCQTDRRYTENDPAIGSLGKLLISIGTQVSLSQDPWLVRLGANCTNRVRDTCRNA